MGELADQADGALSKRRLAPSNGRPAKKTRSSIFGRKLCICSSSRCRKRETSSLFCRKRAVPLQTAGAPGKLCELAVVFGKQIFADQQVKDGHFSVLGPVAVSDVRRNGEYVPPGRSRNFFRRGSASLGPVRLCLVHRNCANACSAGIRRHEIGEMVIQMKASLPRSKICVLAWSARCSGCHTVLISSVRCHLLYQIFIRKTENSGI